MCLVISSSTQHSCLRHSTAIYVTVIDRREIRYKRHIHKMQALGSVYRDSANLLSLTYWYRIHSTLTERRARQIVRDVLFIFFYHAIVQSFHNETSPILLYSASPCKGAVAVVIIIVVVVIIDIIVIINNPRAKRKKLESHRSHWSGVSRRRACLQLPSDWRLQLHMASFRRLLGPSLKAMPTAMARVMLNFSQSSRE